MWFSTRDFCWTWGIIHLIVLPFSPQVLESSDLKSYPRLKGKKSGFNICKQPCFFLKAGMGQEDMVCSGEQLNREVKKWLYYFGLEAAPFLTASSVELRKQWLYCGEQAQRSPDTHGPISSSPLHFCSWLLALRWDPTLVPHDHTTVLVCFYSSMATFWLFCSLFWCPESWSQCQRAPK